MPKTRLFWLFIIGLVISSALTWAVPPQDYTISYTFKNPDGTVFRITKYYLRDGNKFRTDYISPTQYNISAGADASTDLSNDTSGNVSSDAQLQAEHLTNVEPQTIEILRKDKNLVWSLDPSFKNYIEVPLKQDAWEHSLTEIFISDFHDFKKTGDTTLLNYTCDIYENVQKVKEETWTNTAYVAQRLNVILKTELRQNGKLVQTMEATEFSTEKPASSLFEIPDGYQKNDSNQ
jgi:outer membrane lipoprotein-sorting protein